MRMKGLYLLVGLGMAACSSAHVDPDASPPESDGSTMDIPPEPCSSNGEIRVTPCGNCGLESQTCTEGFWQGDGRCLDEKECRPGAVEDRPTSMCGSESRVCDDQCVWRDWTTTSPDGECVPGTVERVEDESCSDGLVRTRECSRSCEWLAGECGPVCGRPLPTSHPDEEEVCIPAGSFLRGEGDGFALASYSPQREVVLSSYWIDRFPVTNRRYEACVDAGRCTEPSSDVGVRSLHDPGRSAFPVQSVSYAQAMMFCEFDGRRLSTEAEWEKAARGPAPRDVPYVTGAEEWDCEQVPLGDCGLEDRDTRLRDEYDALPATRSFYGVELLQGSGPQWVADWYAEDYYEDDMSLVDPRGPMMGEVRVLRGFSRLGTSWPLYHRFVSSGDDGGSSTTIRCARSAASDG